MLCLAGKKAEPSASQPNRSIKIIECVGGGRYSHLTPFIVKHYHCVFVKEELEGTGDNCSYFSVSRPVNCLYSYCAL